MESQAQVHCLSQPDQGRMIRYPGAWPQVPMPPYRHGRLPASPAIAESAKVAVVVGPSQPQQLTHSHPGSKRTQRQAVVLRVFIQRDREEVGRLLPRRRLNVLPSVLLLDVPSGGSQLLRQTAFRLVEAPARSGGVPPRLYRVGPAQGVPVGRGFPRFAALAIVR